MKKVLIITLLLMVGCQKDNEITTEELNTVEQEELVAVEAKTQQEGRIIVWKDFALNQPVAIRTKNNGETETYEFQDLFKQGKFRAIVPNGKYTIIITQADRTILHIPIRINNNTKRIVLGWSEF